MNKDVHRCNNKREKASKWLNELWYVHLMDSQVAMEKNEVDLHGYCMA